MAGAAEHAETQRHVLERQFKEIRNEVRALWSKIPVKIGTTPYQNTVWPEPRPAPLHAGLIPGRAPATPLPQCAGRAAAGRQPGAARDVIMSLSIAPNGSRRLTSSIAGVAGFHSITR